MLLINPPNAKSCEPPAGIACLAGALRGHGLPCFLLDANLEGQLFLLASPSGAKDTWSRRARRGLAANLKALRSRGLYTVQDRYQRAVADVNRLLELAGRTRDVFLSLANYQDPAVSPLRSEDLIRAAGRPEDNIFYPYFAPRLSQLMKDERPSMVGFSLNYLSQAACTFAMAGFITQHYGVPIVLGGGLVTSWLRNPGWRNPFGELIDHLVAGPGEERLVSLMGGVPDGRHYAPDFDGLPIDDYLAPGFILPYAASSGCYWNKCSFCPEKAEENPYLPMRPEQVLADVGNLVIRTRPSLLHFLDNAVSPALMDALIASPPGVDWYGFARIAPKLANEDFCMALRRSGCVMLKLGLESGDQSVLDSMHKGIDLATASKALRALKDAGIATYVYLLFGTPSESLVQARSTLDFIGRHEREVTFLNLAVFNMPVCGVEARSLPVSDFYEGDLSLYTDFDHPDGWNRREVRSFLDREFKRHPSIAGILRRDPPYFTSNHAAFFSSSL